MNVIILLLLLLLASTSSAQQEPVIERLTIEQGLSQSIVYNMLQDHRGFLWICTRDGLNRYDGYGFTIFRHDPFDSSSLPWTAVNSIAEDYDGNFWLAVGTGVCKLERSTGRFIRYPLTHVLRSGTIGLMPKLARDGQGMIWAGSEHGLVRINPSTGAATLFRAVRNDPFSLTNDTVGPIFADHSGAIWVSTDRHLLRFDSRRGAFTRISVGPVGAHSIRCVGQAKNGTICCSYFTSSNVFNVAMLDPVTGAVVRTIADPARRYYVFESQIDAMCLDSLDGLWLRIISFGRTQQLTVSAWLARVPLTGETGTMVISGPSRRTIGKSVFTMMCDRSGIIWIGTEDGLTKVMLERPRFRTYRSNDEAPQSLCNDHVRGLCVDHYGQLWAGTDNGLSRFDRHTGNWARYLYDWRNPRSISSNTVNVILEENDGTLLLGTNAGINTFHRSTNTFSCDYVAPGQIIQAWSLYRDSSSGVLWVGTLFNGIFLFDRNKELIRHFAASRIDSSGASIGYGVVWDMHHDHLGVLWIATSAGLYQWLPATGRFRRLGVYPADPHGLGNENVCAILEDNAGELWFTTYGGGINRYNRATDSFTRITTHDGLPSNMLYGTLADRSGRLWISSGAGLTAYDPATGKCHIYTAADGLQSNEFSFKAFCLAPDGEMFFGGTYGLNSFHPDELTTSSRPVPMVVTEFRTFDTVLRRDLRENDTVVIAHDRSYISFQFTALEFRNVAGIRYAYRLTGFDDAWIYCGDRRYASYTNLDPGTYTFMVAATNSDGVWNPHPLRIILEVVPPYWMTWWFRGFVGLAALLLAAGGSYLWVRSTRAKEALRRRNAESQLQALRLQINPHFIFNALSSIQHLILTKDRDRAVDYLTRFARLIRSTLDNSERASIPLADEVENLRLYLYIESLRFEGSFHYQIEIDPAIDLRQTRIPPMLIQPFVENAIRHGLRHRQGQGTLTISMAARGDAIHCRVEDDGVGRRRAAELRELATGSQRSMGVHVTRERLSILNAASVGEGISMEITDLRDSAGAPSGTRVDIIIPIESD